MADMNRWPLCLRLPSGGIDLMLPAALVEQVLACHPVVLPAMRDAGWQEVGVSPGGSVVRLRFVVPDQEVDVGWSGCWMAVLRRVRGHGVRRHAVLLSGAPELLPPLHEGVAIAQASPSPDVLATVTLASRRMVVPAVDALYGRGEAA